EAPWWIYRSSAPTRNAMWVRSEKNHLLLSDRVGWETAIELSSDINKSIDQWLALSKLGVCLRPRALLTTMFSRLLISDLFVHGIGGAKYDQITDAIVREFFQVQPRPIAIATATMHFPFDRIDSGFRHMVLSAPATKIELKQKQRQAEYHPELLSFDTKDPDIGLLAEKKRQLLANIPLRGNRWEWHHEISSVNQQLRLLQDERLRKMTQLLDEQEALIRQFRLLCSREYSFCLFPLEQLTDALKHLSFHP
ncbi:MAG: hypothetical protein KDB03_09990, partial [Planctomycetales bacterium]|nr:hypothetical protein [Planctomycetales bacterium]